MDFKKEVVEELKLKGLDVAEDAVKALVEVVFEVGEKAIIKSENKYDDFLLAVLPKGKEMLLELVDKIDGQQN